MTVAAKVKQTAASLRGVQTTLEQYSVQSQDDEARVAFREAIEVIGEVTHELDKRIKTLEFEEPQYKGF